MSDLPPGFQLDELPPGFQLDAPPPAPMAKPYEEATTGQKLASPLVKVLTNAAGFPGGMLELAGTALERQPIENDPLPNIDPWAAIKKVGAYLSPRQMEKPFQEAGVVPADPEYKNPSLVGRALDTVTEYVGGAMMPGLLGKAMPKAAPPPVPQPPAATNDLKIGLAAGVPAALARVVAPDSPIAEMIVAALGGLTAAKAPAVAEKAGGLLPSVTKAGREAVTEQRAGKMLSEAANKGQGGSTAAIENIENAPALATGGFKPTTGTISQNESLLQLEKGVVNSPAYRERVRGNERAISESVDQTLSPTEGATDPAQAFRARATGAQEKADTRVAGAQQRLAATEGLSVEQQLAAQKALDAEKAPIQQMAGSDVRESAAVAAKGAVQTAKTAEKDVVDELYARVDPGTPVTFDNTRKAAETAKVSAGETGSVPAIIDNIIAKREAGTPQPFSELQADLRNVNSAAKQAARAGDDNTARMLNEVRRGIEADLDAAAGSSAELKIANERYKTEYAPQFKEGASAQVLKEGATPESKTLDRYMATPEGARQYARIVKGDAAGQKAARDFFINDLAAKGGKLTPESLNKYLQDKAAQLNAFPEVRTEIQQMRNRIASGSTKAQQIETDVAAAVEKAKGAVKVAETGQKKIGAALKRDPATKFIEGDPDTAISGALSDPVAMRKLRVAAMKYGGESAVEGLRNAVKAKLNRDIRNAGTVTRNDNLPDAAGPADFKVSLAKANELLARGTPSRAAMENLFTSDDMAALDKYRKQLEVSARVREQGVSGSNTRELFEAATATGRNEAITLSEGTLRGGMLRRALDFVEKKFLGDPKGKLNELIVDAMLDPQLARTLMMKYDASTAAVVERRLAGHIAALQPTVGDEED